MSFRTIIEPFWGWTWLTSSSPTTTRTSRPTPVSSSSSSASTAATATCRAGRPTRRGIAGGVLRGAGNILGGIFGRAVAGSYEIQQAIGGPAHDNALEEAVTEIRPLFIQCKRCGQWVCREICWNAERGLCTNCAPILQRELARQAGRDRRRAGRGEAARARPHRGREPRRAAVVHCPNCGAETARGQVLLGVRRPAGGRRTSARAAGPSSAGAKFCPECGGKIG